MKSIYYIDHYDYFIILAILILAVYLSMVYSYKNRMSLLFCFINSVLVIASSGFRYYSGISSGFDDSGFYYNLSQVGMAPNIGTFGIVWVVSFFTQYLGLSFIVISSIFSSLVLFSCNILLFSFINVTPERERKVVYAIFTIIVPISLGFWCGAIGKDAMTALGSSLIISALSRNKFFSPLMILGMALFIFPRPHLAPVLLGSFTLALFLGKDIYLKYKIPLLAFSISALLILTPIAIAYFAKGNLFELDQLVETIGDRSQRFQDSGSFIDVSSMSYPYKVFSYLFRPSILDINNIMSLIAAINNLLILVLFAYLIFAKKEITYSLRSFRFTFPIVFSIILICIVSYAMSNLGIAMRQKWMFIPMLIFALNLARLHALSRFNDKLGDPYTKSHSC